MQDIKQKRIMKKSQLVQEQVKQKQKLLMEQ